MKQILTLRIIFIVAFFTSFIGIATSQRSYNFTYEVEVAAEAPSPYHGNDTVTVMNLFTNKSETKIIQAKPIVGSPIRALFASDGEAGSFVDSLLYGLEAGTIKGYTDIDSKDPLSLAEIKRRIFVTDTVIAINPVTLQEETKIIRGMRNISRLVFYENWNIDKAGSITKRVKGYGLLTKNYDMGGILLGYFNFVTIKN